MQHENIYVSILFNVYEDEMKNHIYIHPHTQHTYCDYIIIVLCFGTGLEIEVIQLVYFAYITGHFYRKFKQSQKKTAYKTTIITIPKVYFLCKNDLSCTAFAVILISNQ